MHDFIDNYCERTAVGLLDEPLNAITNAAFWIAAIWVWKLARERAQNRNNNRSSSHIAWDMVGLFLLLLGIGLGSLAFHTFANGWSLVLDGLFIALYLHWYFAVYVHRVVGVSWKYAWLSVPLFALLSLALSWAWRTALPSLLPASLLGGDGSAVGTVAGYLSAWTVLATLWLHSRKLESIYAATATTSNAHRASNWLLAALCAFVISLTMRQIDLPLCDAFSIGTHWGWHIFNSITLGCTLWFMVQWVYPRHAV